ncbi:MAG TPA: LD-carboxypeptidase [Longimicrobiales bacterium]|nr:LD-carboxypeptidase [Longimicrobiales bacterium]
MSDVAAIRPPRLRPGSRVALIAPAGPVAEDRVDVALARCREFGLEPVPGRSARARHGYLAGDDAARSADLAWALGAPDIDAVWALRGGYGTMRLLAGVDLAPLRERPRAYIGFSDNTAVHMALRARGLVSFHAPHAGGDMTGLAQDCFERVLFHAEPAGVLEQPATPASVTLTGGTAEGPLVGGNLAILAAMCGTPAPPIARGSILFLEDVGEAPYRIDRAWTQLLLCGALDGVAGIAFGRFTECGVDNVVETLHELSAPLGVPVVAELPIGHEPDNWTLPLGIRARLADGGLELLEAAVD